MYVSAYACRLKDRSLLLPWNIRFAGSRVSGALGESTAECFCRSMLKAVGQWDTGDFIERRDYVPYEDKLCFYCKSKTTAIGFHPCCDQCKSEVAGLDKTNSFAYWSAYFQTLEFASTKWQAHLIEPQTDSHWMTSYLEKSPVLIPELPQNPSQNLREYLLARLTKRIAS